MARRTFGCFEETEASVKAVEAGRVLRSSAEILQTGQIAILKMAMTSSTSGPKALMASAMTQAHKTLYHYSTNDYEPGHLITQEIDHYERLTNTQRAIEDELRKHSLEAAEKRATCVYAWESRETAEIGWCHKEGTHLYELVVDGTDIRHVGDIDIYTAIGEALSKKEPVDALRRDYWEGKRTGKRIEVLASKAKVVRKLKDSSERLTPMQRAMRKQREGM